MVLLAIMAGSLVLIGLKTPSIENAARHLNTGDGAKYYAIPVLLVVALIGWLKFYR
jgi:hypothetical protein